MGAQLLSCARCGGLLSGLDDACSSCGEPQATLEKTKMRAELSSEARVFEGKWEIVSKIGEGGMGTVYLATELALDRKVAIKTLSKTICSDPSMVARFEREAKMMAKLDHPNLVPIHAVGRHEDTPFIVMKFLEGTNLSEHMRAKGRLQISETLQIMKQVCSALGFVHSRGVIHRDIKPANIFISPEGHVTLLDLGVAHDPKSSMTRSGVMMGTPRYMPPEQVLGQKVDHRSDLYALGVMLFEMIAGKLPFDGDSDFSVMRAHTDALPPDPTENSDLPREIGVAVRRALAKKPDDRFQSAADLFAAFEAAVGSRGMTGSQLRSIPDGGDRRTPRPHATPRPTHSDTVISGAGPALPLVQGTPEDPVVVQKSRAPVYGALALLVLAAGGLSFTFLRETPPTVQVIELPLSDPKTAEPTTVALVEPKAAEPKAAEPKAAEPKAAEPKVAEPKVAEPKVAEPKVAGPKAVEAKPAEPRQVASAKAPIGPAEVLVSVTVNGAPSWAWLDVDGMRQGATPKKLKLDPAKHTIHLERPGFKPIDREVVLSAGEAKKMPLKLEPL